MRETIRRATEEFNTTGRTLEGLAFRFDHPSRVTDPGRPPYLEAIARGAATKTLRERHTWPVDYYHGLMPGTTGARSRWAGEVFGPVIFRAGDVGLEFEATLSKTRGADEMLELLRDGALGDVSIEADVIKTAHRSGVVWRDEIALRALSLVPPGRGQHADAKVLAMRAAATPRLDALRRRRAVLNTRAAVTAVLRN